MNTNLLKGMKCPQCGLEGPFRIEVTLFADIYDDGLRIPAPETEWDTSSPCYCPNCSFGEFLGDFDPLMRTTPPQP